MKLLLNLAGCLLIQCLFLGKVVSQELIRDDGYYLLVNNNAAIDTLFAFPGRNNPPEIIDYYYVSQDSIAVLLLDNDVKDLRTGNKHIWYIICSREKLNFGDWRFDWLTINTEELNISNIKGEVFNSLKLKSFRELEIKKKDIGTSLIDMIDAFGDRLN